MRSSEFVVKNAYSYDQRSVPRWILSHVWRYKFLALVTVVMSVASNAFFAQGPVQVGRAAQEILNPTTNGALLGIGLAVLAVLVMSGITELVQSLMLAMLSQHFEADSRQELYASLLGKSQTFHDRQRVGDIMARATDDVEQLNALLNPGMMFIFSTVLGIVIPMLYIAFIRLDLLIVPIVFIAAYVFTLRRYTKRLNPVAMSQRTQFGVMNAGLEETISGIEVVKASAQEVFERQKFRKNARQFRDYFVQQGDIEARYLPLLLLGFAIGISFLQAILLYEQKLMSIADVVAFMGLIALFRFPTFVSIFSFSLVQAGLAAGERILQILRAETELDQNTGGLSKPIDGDIVFDHVTFGYSAQPLLKDISFHVKAGQTVAIVGQTGSGKSTLTQLVNRTYDVGEGSIMIDGVNVRDWNLTSLRSQISNIEQDIFLFSRSIAENIAFGAPSATQQQIEQAAHEAQAHDFIMSFKDGYQTVIGERGVTLSGGQRQRIALARAFLSNPRILILDDSTSAIDSATEDEIQRAIRRAEQGRTTLLITHRLSQIRWADHILVLDHGALVAKGTHDELLRRSADYRRIFARYDMELPPLEVASVAESPVA